MDQETRRIVEGLKKAVEAEIAGYHFYMMAARSTEDAKGREVFEQLVQEELEHVRFLKAQHESFRETGRPDETAVLGKSRDLSESSPIFSERIRQRIGDAHYEMSALSIGLELELSSTNFYKTEAEAAGLAEVRSFYERLADWEAGHYKALRTQQEELKDEYWAKGGFSPF